MKTKISRIGRQPVEIPEGVKTEIVGQRVTISGSKGNLVIDCGDKVLVELIDGKLKVSPRNKSKKARSMHGLIRTLLANAVWGVTRGWQKTLKIVGTGYRVRKNGKMIEMSLGFSHLVNVSEVEGIEFEVKGNDTIVVKGIDKQKVGELAAAIRRKRKPDSYKGKGIRYEGEVVKLKPGKAGKVGAG